MAAVHQKAFRNTSGEGTRVMQVHMVLGRCLLLGLTPEELAGAPSRSAAHSLLYWLQITCIANSRLDATKQRSAVTVYGAYMKRNSSHTCSIRHAAALMIGRATILPYMIACTAVSRTCLLGCVQCAVSSRGNGHFCCLSGLPGTQMAASKIRADVQAITAPASSCSGLSGAGGLGCSCRCAVSGGHGV